MQLLKDFLTEVHSETAPRSTEKGLYNICKALLGASFLIEVTSIWAATFLYATSAVEFQKFDTSWNVKGVP